LVAWVEDCVVFGGEGDGAGVSDDGLLRVKGGILGAFVGVAAVGGESG